MKNCQTLDRMPKLSASDRAGTGRVIARSFYQILRRNGFTQAEIIDVAGHVLDGVIRDIKVNGKNRERPVDLQKRKVRTSSTEVA